MPSPPRPAGFATRVSDRAFFAILAGIFAVEFVVLAIAPVSRSTWLLENWLVFGLILLLVFSGLRFHFSRTSYLLIFLFLVMHEVGSHYEYSNVPYDAAWQALFGFSLDDALGFERNHYDRLIHFMYGLLLAYPMRELLLRVVTTKRHWSYLLAFGVTLATSAVYELIEWGAAVVFGGDLGHAYVGAQGDEWDAHRDMSLAALGAALAMAITAWAEHNRIPDDPVVGPRELDPSRGRGVE